MAKNEHTDTANPAATGKISFEFPPPPVVSPTTEARLSACMS